MVGRFTRTSARPVAALIAALVLSAGPAAAFAAAAPVDSPAVTASLSASTDPFADLAADGSLTVKEVRARIESGGMGTMAKSGGIGTMANTYGYCAILDGQFGCKSGYNTSDGLVVAIVYENRWFNTQNDGLVGVIYNPNYSVGCTSRTSDFEGGANFPAVLDDKVSSVRTYNGCDITLWSRSGLQFEGTSWIHEEDDLNPSGWNNVASSFEIS